MTPPDRPLIGAAVDVGSNSLHLLVGRLSDGSVEALHDESLLLGLGDVVDSTGELPAEARAAAVEALLRYRARALDLGAEVVMFVGTEPVRRASNRAALCAEVEAATGLPLHVLSERREAELTFLGVTGGQRQAESLLVIDIGGGSTEVTLGIPGQSLAPSGLPSGSARLSSGIVAHDPPTPPEIEGLRRAAGELVARLPATPVERAVFVGGTATNLIRLDEPSLVGLERMYRHLAALPAAAVAERYGVNLRRARQLAAGAAITEAVLVRHGLQRGEVSEASLREGTILAAGRLGDEWPDRLDELLPP